MKNLYFVDLTKDKSLLNPYLGETLLSKIHASLQEKKKVILYLNKRGEYNFLICSDCHHIEKCPKCDVALSIHTAPTELVCHHCNFRSPLPLECPKCHGTHLQKIGVGTQQVETIIQKIFSSANIFRFDSDSTANLTQKKATLQHLQNADIIIGTKMLTTGFDFKNVGVIGVILVEQELQIPKYDTEEKIYATLKQLIGRGGRLGSDTDIVLQSYIPNNPMIENIMELNYKDFIIKTLQERKLFGYPPFQEHATIRYKHKDKKELEDFLETFYQKLLRFESDIEISKIQTYYKRDNQFFGHIILKGNHIRSFLQNVKKDILKNKDLVVIFD